MSTDIIVPITILAKNGSAGNAVVLLDVSGPDTMVEMPPDGYTRSMYTLADPYTTEIANYPSLSCTGTNTESARVTVKGQFHVEGGYPISVDVNETEEKVKYAKRMARDEHHQEALMIAVPRLGECLRANNAIDVYESFFDPLSAATQRSKALCPWRFTASSGESVGTSAYDFEALRAQHRHLVRLGHVPPMAEDADNNDQGSVGATDERDAASIAYTDPSVLHALHVATKLSTPAFPNGMFVCGTTTAGSSFTCGSDSTTIVVGYCESVLPSYHDGGAGAKPLTGPSFRSAPSTVGAEPTRHAARRSTVLAGSMNHSASMARTPESHLDDAFSLSCAGAVWSTTDPSTPQNLLTSNCGGATAIVASYRDPHIIHGGHSSGVISLWDTRVGSGATGRPVSTSLRDYSHHDAVTHVQLVTTRATECFSCGLDGQVLFWDLRRMSQCIPEETVKLRNLQTGAPAAATHIDFDPLVGGTLKYLVSTLEGQVFSCNRRAPSGSSRGNAGAGGIRQDPRVTSVSDVHFGACFTVQRCPVLPKVFATVGDWHFKLHGDDVRLPLFQSPLVSAHVTCGCWHPTRPSVFMCGTSDGDALFYDLLQCSSGPVMKLRAASSPLRHLVPHVTGRTVAATDYNGEVHIISLPAMLFEPTHHERQKVIATLERTYARERLSNNPNAAASNSGPSGGHRRSTFVINSRNNSVAPLPQQEQQPLPPRDPHSLHVDVAAAYLNLVGAGPSRNPYESAAATLRAPGGGGSGPSTHPASLFEKLKAAATAPIRHHSSDSAAASAPPAAVDPSPSP